MRYFSLLLSLGVLALILCACPARAQAPAGLPVAVHVDRQSTLLTSQLVLGCTRTERDLDNVACDPAALTSASRLINGVARFQNAHILGWGAGNPEPRPGVYQWADLDKRMAMIRAAHATPIITLCGAPDWMKGGVEGQTDWKLLTTAPTPDHIGDFAALAATIARRYPDVMYFQVWNEFKGLWDKSSNSWDSARYTDMYNAVYDALKSVNPKIQVGGPYLVIGGTADPIEPRNMAVLDYWNRHKHGADFFVIDKSLIAYADKTPYTLDQKLSYTHTFEDVVRQVKAISNLPVWYAEYYISCPPPNSMPATDVLNASVLRHMVLAGTSVALMWQPMESGNQLQGLVTDCRVPGGGQATPFYHAFSIISNDFGRGTRICPATVSSPDVEVLASPTRTLLINDSGRPVDVDMDGRKVALSPYQVLLINNRGQAIG